MKKLLIVAAAVFVGLAFAARAEERGWFNVSFADYAQGQSLSSAGAAGGAWETPIPANATNVYDGARNGIALSSIWPGGVLFEPEATARPAEGDVERIDFGMCAAEMLGGVPPDFDGAAGFCAARFDNGESRFVGATADGWIKLRGDGIAPAADVWFDGRIELRTVEGIRLVSYLVKKGDEYVRLADDAGTTWFRTVAPQSPGNVVARNYATVVQDPPIGTTVILR